MCLNPIKLLFLQNTYISNFVCKIRYICEVICPLSVHIDGLLVQNLPGPGRPLRAGGKTRPKCLQQQRLAAHRRAEVREGDAPVPETRGLHY